jgi:hypothetical protein
MNRPNVIGHSRVDIITISTLKCSSKILIAPSIYKVRRTEVGSYLNTVMRHEVNAML